MTPNSELRYKYDVFSLQKDGNSPEEYEDAYAFSNDDLRVALADGASDSIYTNTWAQLLVNGFIQNPFDIERNGGDFVKWLELRQQEWQSLIDWKDLPWYKERKARIGAFSTLLTLQLVTTEEKSSILSLASGDSCLFVLADDNSFKSFPIQSVSEFTNSPNLLCSYQRHNTKVNEQIQFFSYEINHIDSIIMATDAFSKWFLSEFEKGNLPWCHFKNMDQTKFIELIASLRGAKEIRNDDTTVILVSFVQ